MDVRQLVDIIDGALGTDATPDRVESIATRILESLPLNDRVRPPVSSNSGNRALITVFGHDHPGILAAVTTVVSEAGCNILDVSQKILQGYFTLIMLADLSSSRETIQSLRQKLGEIETSLHVRALIQHEELFNTMHRP